MEFIVVFGGESWEHEISIVSAITLKKELKNIAHFVFIDSENDAYLIPREMMKSTHFSSLAYKKDAQVSFTKGGFLQCGFLKKQILRGIVINLIHGKSGEDGQIAGILDFYQIPFVGPRIEACAVSFSKEMTKIYAESVGVRVLEYCVVDSASDNSVLGMQFRTCENFQASTDSSLVESPKISTNTKATPQSLRLRFCESQNLGGKSVRVAESSLDSADSTTNAESANKAQQTIEGIAVEVVGFLDDFGRKTGLKSAQCPKSSKSPQDAPKSKLQTQDKFAFPCIIKPSHLGSSLGIAIAKNKDDLPYALDCAFEYDCRAIIEPFIPHIREFNLAGCKINGEFVFSMIEEVKKDEFFGFEDKYLDFQGGQKKQTADLSDEMSAKIQENFKAIYNNCFEGALIRCDFFLLDDEIYLNEINPIPGSLAHYLFDDFNCVLQNLAQNLPKERKIPVKYQYISKIQAQKGK